MANGESLSPRSAQLEISGQERKLVITPLIVFSSGPSVVNGGSKDSMGTRSLHKIYKCLWMPGNDILLYVNCY